MLLRAFAKINLDLRIIGRRPDGYHELRTVLQTIDLHDRIRIEPAPRFEFHAPAGMDGDDNLVVRAVRAFEKAAGVRVDVRIELDKRIPVGAGLGGGSADAAVTVAGLERMTGRRLSGPVLLECLRGLGSDVPFFAVGGRAVAVGRGDEVYPLEDEREYGLLLAVPEFAVNTAAAYSWLTVQESSHSIVRFCAQFARGRDTGDRRNDFEGPVFARHPDLAEIRAELMARGAAWAALTGSGAAMFGVFPTGEDALQASGKMPKGMMAIPAVPLSRAAYFERMFAVGEDAQRA
jgi:4-diphosphocytidyl-2-C-methyl-D-erythritol kinase